MLFGFGLIGIMWIGGSGESMGNRAFLWAKNFIEGCGSGEFS